MTDAPVCLNQCRIEGGVCLTCGLTAPPSDTAGGEPEESLVRIVRRAMEWAQGRGLDHAGQMRRAIADLQSVRPGMTTADAAFLVERIV